MQASAFASLAADQSHVEQKNNSGTPVGSQSPQIDKVKYFFYPSPPSFTRTVLASEKGRRLLGVSFANDTLSGAQW